MNNALEPRSSDRRMAPREPAPEPLFAEPAQPGLTPGRLRELLHVLRKRRGLLVAIWAGVVAAGIGLLMLATPVYTASAVLQISPRAAQGTHQLLPRAELQSREVTTFYETQYELLRSRSLAEQVIARENLLYDPVLELRPERPELEASATSDLVDRYNDSFLSVSPVADTQLVRVAMTLPHPELARRVLSAHLTGYLEQELARNTRANSEARDFLRAELARLRAELRDAEAELSDYRREHGILSLDGKENTVVERLADLNNRLTAAQVSRLSNEAQVHLLRDGGNTTLPTVVSDPTIQALKQQLASIEAEQAKLGATLKPTYPRLVELASQANSLRARIAAETENLASVVRSKHAAALEEERALREELEAQRQMALEQKDTTLQYALLARDLETTRSLHDTVLQRLKEIDLVAETYPSHVYVIDPPTKPSSPSFPRYGTSLALASLVGLMLGVSTVMGLETFDRSIRSPREANQSLGLPVLASVPDFRRLPEGGLAPSDSDLISQVSLSESVSTGVELSPAPESVVTEAYRTIRTNLMLNRRRRDARTILVTSARLGEGKTVTALNTAITFAEYAVPVLLIDADFRRPTFQHSLGLSPRAGLSDVLTGQAKAADAIVKSQLGLSFLAAGSSAAQTGALLGSERMQELLDALKEEYAYILIDGPPILPVADSVVMSTLVEGVVLVIDQPETPRELAEEAERRLRGVGASLLGCVLNRVRPDDPTFAPSVLEYYG